MTQAHDNIKTENDDYSAETAFQSVKSSYVPADRQRSETRAGFQVAASPLNAVKLELAIIVVMAILLLLLVNALSTEFLTQVAILSTFSMLSAIWLVVRTRRLIKKYNEQTGDS